MQPTVCLLHPKPKHQIRQHAPDYAVSVFAVQRFEDRLQAVAVLLGLREDGVFDAAYFVIFQLHHAAQCQAAVSDGGGEMGVDGVRRQHPPGGDLFRR